MEKFKFQAKGAGRIDRALQEGTAALGLQPELSRAQIQKLIENGNVTVDGKVEKRAGTKIKDGATLTLVLENVPRAELTSIVLDLKIVYEDDFLLVIDKPAGLSMHPGAGNRSKTLLNAVLGRLNMSPERWPSDMRPGIVHRLDKDTSGLVVVAKRPDIHQELSRQFAVRSVERVYLALALCTPRGNRIIRRQDDGRIETLLGRDAKSRVKMAVLSAGGRRAVTNWRVIERMSHACLLELSLETGRTHQIRVHLAHIACPIIGDQVYGDFSSLPPTLKRAASDFARQALHAKVLGFDHPKLGKRLHFESEPPSDFLELVNVFRTVQN